MFAFSACEDDWTPIPTTTNCCSRCPWAKWTTLNLPDAYEDGETRAIVIENGNVKAINDEGEPMTIKK